MDKEETDKEEIFGRNLKALELLNEFFDLENIEIQLSAFPELKNFLSGYNFKTIRAEFASTYDHPTLDNAATTFKILDAVSKKVADFQKANGYESLDAFKTLEEINESGIYQTMSKKEKICVNIEWLIAFNRGKLRNRVKEGAERMLREIRKIRKK